MPPGIRMEYLTWSVRLKACRASIGKGDAVDDAARELLVDLARSHELGDDLQVLGQAGDVTARRAHLQAGKVFRGLDPALVVVEHAGTMHPETEQFGALVFGLGVERAGIDVPVGLRTVGGRVGNEGELADARAQEPVVLGEGVQTVGDVDDALCGKVEMFGRGSDRFRQDAHGDTAVGGLGHLLCPGLDDTGDDRVFRRQPGRQHEFVGLGRADKAGQCGCRCPGQNGKRLKLFHDFLLPLVS